MENNDKLDAVCYKLERYFTARVYWMFVGDDARITIKHPEYTQITLYPKTKLCVSSISDIYNSIINS